MRGQEQHRDGAGDLRFKRKRMEKVPGVHNRTSGTTLVPNRSRQGRADHHRRRHVTRCLRDKDNNLPEIRTEQLLGHPACWPRHGRTRRQLHAAAKPKMRDSPMPRQVLIHHPKPLPISASFGVRYLHTLMRRWAASTKSHGPGAGACALEW